MSRQNNRFVAIVGTIPRHLSVAAKWWPFPSYNKHSLCWQCLNFQPWYRFLMAKCNCNVRRRAVLDIYCQSLPECCHVPSAIPGNGANVNIQSVNVFKIMAYLSLYCFLRYSNYFPALNMKEMRNGAGIVLVHLMQLNSCFLFLVATSNLPSWSWSQVRHSYYKQEQNTRIFVLNSEISSDGCKHLLFMFPRGDQSQFSSSSTSLSLSQWLSKFRISKTFL